MHRALTVVTLFLLGLYTLAILTVPEGWSWS